MRGRGEMSIYRWRGWEPLLMAPHAARRLNKAVEHLISPLRHIIYFLCLFLFGTTHLLWI